MSVEWGYEEDNGPEVWPKLYSQAKGERQSPINIKTSETKNYHGRLEISYADNMTPVLSNTGHGWRVTHCGKDKKIKGGPLQGTYVLEQFHCHWGESENSGSEHLVDGQGFAGELHFVHWNSDKYKSFEEAASQEDGLAVVAVFLKVGKTHIELQKIVELLPEITYKSQQINLGTNININKLLPSKFDYWNYHGSLTTPPFNESVNWIVLKEAIEVSPKQLEAFRELRTYTKDGRYRRDNREEGRLIKNVRPVQRVGNRVIRDSGVN